MEPQSPSAAASAETNELPSEPSPAPAPTVGRRILDAIAPLFIALVYLVSFVYLNSLTAITLARTAGVSKFFFRPGVPPRGEFFLLIDTVVAPLMFGLTVLFLRVFHRRRTLASLGLRWPSGRGAAWRDAWLMPGATLGFLLLWMLAVLPFGASFRYRGVSAEAAGLPGAPTSSVAILVLLLAAFLVQGAMEEWMMRGYIYQVFKERWTVWGAIIGSSLLFAALHGANPDTSWVALLNTFLIGVILALLVERSGSLWGATLAHGVWNFAVACLVSVPVSGINIFHLLDVTPAGPVRVTGGAYGPEASVVVTVLALPVIALLLPAILARRANADRTAVKLS